MKSRWLPVTATYVALTLVYAWPLLGRMSTVLPHDVGDPALNAWIIWWNAHAWPLTEAWWNAPMFYPAAGAFALSETFLSVAPLTSPLQWLGLDAIVTYNVTFLISFPLTALAAHALAYRLTGRHDAAFIAGLSFGFSPWRTAQMPHLQMLLMWWMPLTLLFLNRYLHPRQPGSSEPARGSAWNLVLAGLCWMMNGFTSGYFLVYFGVLVGCWAVWFLRTRRDWIAVTATLALSSLPLVPLLLGYHEIQSGYGLARSPEEISAFSADLSAIWATSPDVWLPSHWTIAPRAEGELYPGAMILLLSVIGAVSAWHAHRSGQWHRFRKIAAIVAGVFAAIAIVSWAIGGWTLSIGGIVISLTRPAKAIFISVFVLAVAMLWDRRLPDVWRRRSVFFFYAAAAALMLLFALGPTARVFGHSFMYQTPYSWLMELPGGSALRVPARFGILFMLCLGQAAALAFARLRRTSKVGSTSGRREPTSEVFAAVIALVVFLEGWVPKLPVDPVPPHFDLLQMRADTPLLELPIFSGYTETAAMLRATRHGHRLVNGTSGYSPPHYDRMVTGLQERDPTVLAALQAHGPLVVFVNSALDEGGRWRDLLDQYPGASPIGRSQHGALYALPARTSASGPAQGSPLRIASITVSARPEDTAALTDNNVKTRWETIGSQAPGDQIVVTFDRPATLTRLEIDLGEFSNDYPRRLRLSVGGGAGPERVVWEGATSGLVVNALLRDHVRLPIAIDLPPGTDGQRLTLTVTEGHKVFSWSIAELRVFGK